MKDETPTLKWSSASGATSYRLIIDDGSAFSDGENAYDKKNIAENRHTIEKELPEDNYWWKAIAVNSAGENESETWKFKIDTTAPESPTIKFPKETVDPNESFTARWSKVSDSSGVTYEVWIDNNSDFSSPEVLENTSKNTTQVPGTLSKDDYHYRVRAWDNAGNASNFSPTSTFQIKSKTGGTSLPPSTLAIILIVIMIGVSAVGIGFFLFKNSENSEYIL